MYKPVNKKEYEAKKLFFSQVIDIRAVRHVFTYSNCVDQAYSARTVI